MQEHFQHSPQLPAGLRPWRAQEADRRVGLPTEETSTSAALHQTPPGLTDVPITLLPLQKREQEQVRMHYRQKVPEYLLGKCAYFLPRVR